MALRSVQVQTYVPDLLYSDHLFDVKQKDILERISSGSPHDLTSSIGSPSLISRAPSTSDQVIILDAFIEHDSRHNSESTPPDVTAASGGHSTPSSAAGSITTRSVVAE
jgi:hypothetical protein